MSSTFEYEITVPTSAIDRNGHVNNVVFVQWMQDVAVRHFSAMGCSEAVASVNGGWVVRSHEVEYLLPAFAGDVIQLRTWVADVKRVRSTRRYEFVRAADGKLLVRGETDWVFVNAGSGKPAAIPAAIAEKLAGAAAEPRAMKERLA